MDHLATRMRRNSENLLVLAGQEPPRRWAEPVSLADVARASVSEIEQYDRVALDMQPGLAVTGNAVADVVHLLAEIIENATTFSAKDTQVAVSGHSLRSGGVLISVIDSGMGMTEDQLAQVNWRLENPPVADVEVSRHMGLFAVAHLAQRHGIRVRLKAAAGGGLIARVWLPGALTSHDGKPASWDRIRTGRASAVVQAVTRTARFPQDPAAASLAGGRFAAAPLAEITVATPPWEALRTTAPPAGKPAGAPPEPVGAPPEREPRTTVLAAGAPAATAPAEEPDAAPPAAEPDAAVPVEEQLGTTAPAAETPVTAPPDGEPHTTAPAEQQPRATTSADQQPRATTPADQQPRATTSADQQPRATTSADQQPRATTSADQQPRATTSADEQPRDITTATEAPATAPAAVTPAVVPPEETTRVAVPTARLRPREARLPIFESVESDWFRARPRAPAHAGATVDPHRAERSWISPGDEGWRAAETVVAPTVGGITSSGLPRRTPQANLVPGTAGAREDRPARAGDSADVVSNRLAGFQRGSRRARAAPGAQSPDEQE